MRKIKKVVSIFMIAAVAFTVAVTNTSISAVDPEGSYSGGSGANAEVTITKELYIAEGVTLDNDLTFTFVATLQSVDNKAYDNSVSGDPYASVNSFSESVKYDAGTVGPVATTATSIKKETDDIFEDITQTSFSHAGVYKYTVVESNTTTIDGNNDGYVVGGKTYTMWVYVYNKPDSGSGYDGTYIAAVTVMDSSKVTDPIDNDLKVDPSPNNGDGNGFLFDNYYNEHTKLTIDKTVTGDMANLNDEFSFTATFTFPESISAAPATSGVSSTGYNYNKITYRIYDKTTGTTITGGTGTLTSNSSTFTLKDNQEIEFSNLPAGTTYTILETPNSNYLTKATVIEGGTAYNTDGTDVRVTSLGQVEINKSAFTSSILLGEKQGTSSYTYPNSTSFVNERNDVSITGLIIDNLPFIALMGVGIVGLVYIALNKKRKSI